MGRGRHIRKPASYDATLDDVVSVAEAASLCHYAPQTIHGWIANQKIAARQSGSVWIISRRSLLEYFKKNNEIGRESA